MTRGDSGEDGTPALLPPSHPWPGSPLVKPHWKLEGQEVWTTWGQARGSVAGSAVDGELAAKWSIAGKVPNDYL